MSETVFSLSLFKELFKRDSMILVKKTKDLHRRTADRTSNGIIAEGRQDSQSPTGKRAKRLVFLFRDSPANTSIGLAMPSIETVVADHLEMFFRDVSDEPFDKVHGRDGFMDKAVILVSVVMKGNSVGSLVIGVNAGSSNNGTAEVTANVFEDGGRITFVAFGVNVEAVFGVAVNGGFQVLEFRREPFLEKIQENSLEGLAEESIVEVRDGTPEAEFIDGTFGDKAVNMRIPI